MFTSIQSWSKCGAYESSSCSDFSDGCLQCAEDQHIKTLFPATFFFLRTMQNIIYYFNVRSITHWMVVFALVLNGTVRLIFSFVLIIAYICVMFLQELFKEVIAIGAHLPRAVVLDICLETNIDRETRLENVARYIQQRITKSFLLLFLVVIVVVFVVVIVVVVSLVFSHKIADDLVSKMLADMNSQMNDYETVKKPVEATSTPPTGRRL